MPSLTVSARGFGPATTRAVVDQPSVTEGDYTYNAQMALAWEGVDAAIASGTSESQFDFMGSYVSWHNSGWSDKYYDVHGTVVASDLSNEFIAAATEVIVGSNGNPGLIPEQGSIPDAPNNLSKAESTGYSIVTTGGPVTLTPIYHNSNSGDRLSYYYYPAGSKPSAAEIKTMPKYSLGEMSNPSQGGNTHIYRNTYSLVYVDANGNCSYDFPANYVINFVISNTWGGQSNEIYQSGGITTVEGGTEASLTSQGKYQVEADRYYTIGETVDTDIAEIKFGKALNIPQFTMENEFVNGPSWGNTRYNYRMVGNNVNGDLEGGSTVYYLQPDKNGTIRPQGRQTEHLSQNALKNLNSLFNSWHLSNNHGALTLLVAKVTTTHIAPDKVEHASEGFTLIEGTTVIANEEHEHASLLKHYLLAAKLHAHTTKTNHLQ